MPKTHSLAHPPLLICNRGYNRDTNVCIVIYSSDQCLDMVVSCHDMTVLCLEMTVSCLDTKVFHSTSNPLYYSFVCLVDS